MANEKSDFARTVTSFRNFVIQKPDSQFPAESGRYHLYISYASPWASRCLAILKLKGLDKAISFSSVQPLRRKTKENDEHIGWVFPDSDTEVLGAERDHLNGAKSIRALYDIANLNYKGKYTVPVLWDKKLNTIVNNESCQILRMFNTEFNHVAENPSLDLYPTNLRAIIDETNEWIYQFASLFDINAGRLYRSTKLRPIPKFHNLYHLKAEVCRSSLQLLPAFLERCPNLKNLILEYSVTVYPEQMDFTNVPRCLISTLEYVEIKKHMIGDETGMKLVNYFLENSAILKTLTLSFSYSSSIELESYKKLLTSTKLSPKCQVIIV
ncbi:unnamed protein product [Arabidopsis halleri]